MRKLALLLLIILSCRGFAQNGQISGVVYDRHDEAIFGANVYLEGTVLGSAADPDGYFRISNVPPGNYTLVVSMIGYRLFKKELTVRRGEKLRLETLYLHESAVNGQPVVVTAGKFEQRRQDVPASISTLDQREIRERNSITVKDALAYISGVNMNSGQINIRGSSGYSQGVGSRVLMLLDGIPFLTADTRDIIYESIPLYLIERVEVLKGAGSALYGSSALGGVVNVITRDIPQQPRYQVRLYGGAYSDPAYPEWKFYNGTRLLNGQSVSFSQRKNRLGLQLGVSRDEDDSYRQNGWYKRWNGGGKLQYNLTSRQQLTVTGNYMHKKRGSFLYWEDLNHALQPPPDQRDDVVETNRYYLTANYRYLFSATRFLTFRGIWYWNRFGDSVARDGGNRSTSRNANGELQFNSQIGPAIFTSGVEATWNNVSSNIFSNRSGVGGAAYAQVEVGLSQKLHATLGARLDFFDIDSLKSDARVNPKLGLVYKPWPGGALRSAVGLGFRAPSMAEAFTSTVTSGRIVVPNPDLKSEKSTYAEAGWNQLYGDWLSSDIAFFYGRYTDLIEGTFGNFIPGLNQVVIQFRNVTRARVQGLEANLRAALWRRKLQLSSGYTYVDPRDLDLDDYLKFRPRHLFYSRAGLRLGAIFLGGDYRYISRVDRIDERFSLLVADADVRVAGHILDARVALSGKLSGAPLRLNLEISNVLRYNYTSLVGSLAAPRKFILSLEAGL